MAQEGLLIEQKLSSNSQPQENGLKEKPLDACSNCGTTDDEEKLYCCHTCVTTESATTDELKIFCLDCGTASHKNKRLFDHRFQDNMQEVSFYSHTRNEIAFSEGEANAKICMALKIWLSSGGTVEAINQIRAIFCTEEARTDAIVGASSSFPAIADGVVAVHSGAARAATSCVAGLGIYSLAVPFVAYPVVMAAEMVYLGIQFGRGTITWNEFGYRVTKSLVRTGVSMGASYAGYLGGAIAGAAIGTAVVGPVGTLIGGIIGGIVGAVSAGALSGVATSKLIDKLFKEKWCGQKQPSQELLTDKALAQFSIKKRDLNDETLFNRKVVDSRYKQLAKMLHPDRPGGTKEGFEELKINYGLLLALVKSEQKQDAVDMVLAISYPGYS